MALLFQDIWTGLAADNVPLILVLCNKKKPVFNEAGCSRSRWRLISDSVSYKQFKNEQGGFLLLVLFTEAALCTSECKLKQ